MWKSDYGLYAIFGYPLEHTRSPVMHNAAFKSLGLRSFYISIPIEPGRFARLVKHLGAVPLDGFNLTVPHKELVMGGLDLIDAEAKRIGAVNTVVRKGKRLIGYNTDAYGFSESLRKFGKFSARGKSALVLGAGGAARACVYTLAKGGAKRIIVANRTRLRAERLCRDLGKWAKKSGTKLSAVLLDDVRAVSARQATRTSVLDGIDLVVNATSLGLKPLDVLPLDPAVLPKRDILIADLIYNPLETKLLRRAAARGYQTLGGRGMLLYQGARAFEIWTGRKAPVSVMEKALGDAMEGA